MAQQDMTITWLIRLNKSTNEIIVENPTGERQSLLYLQSNGRSLGVELLQLSEGLLIRPDYFQSRFLVCSAIQGIKPSWGLEGEGKRIPTTDPKQVEAWMGIMGFLLFYIDPSHPIQISPTLHCTSFFAFSPVPKKP